MIYLILFFEFFKIGLFAVGGGLATLPFLHELVEKYGWITENELLNMIAVSESTPGPIGTNVATYVGYDVAGIPGGVIATLGEVVPAIIMITLIARSLHKWHANPLAQAGFAALRPTVSGLLAAVSITLARSELLHADSWRLPELLAGADVRAIVMCGILLAVLPRVKWHPVWVMLGAAVVGMVFKL